MKKTALLIAAIALAMSAAPVNAGQKSSQSGGASSYAPKGSGVEGRNAAPGQQMLNRRTSATAPGKSFNAPGQKMIRERTPGGTK